MDVKEKIMDNKDIFTDKKVFGDILVDIDNATSLREHVKQNLDFYDRVARKGFFYSFKNALCAHES